MSNVRLLGAVRLLSVIVVGLAAGGASAQCRDAVVLVHGNAGSPSDWSNTYDELLRQGYASADIFRPSWGSKTCAACNDHSGSEETPVRDAINSALSRSCTGKIDVIGHSMGVTLAAKKILDLGVQGKVDAFVGIAGAYRGLWSCGTYPFNVATSTCGYWGLSVSSPFLDWLYGKRMAGRIYSIKSWYDQVICATGVCTVGGVHSSQIANENASYTFSHGHFGLQTSTAALQVDLLTP
ncbi:MAG: lipase family protein [Myxococcaceae bacterium]|nr:lipase family protein [Myxococcaceae bacterium]MCI0672685.1 lipase family protein [Myxococcaceae bacterium]